MLSCLFLTALCQSCRSAFFVNLVLLAIVRLLGTENHRSLTCTFGVVVPHWLLSDWGFFCLFTRVFEGLLFSPPRLLFPKADATLIVVEVES